MADCVLGSWEIDLSSITGLDEFGAAMGYPAELLKVIRDMSYSITFSEKAGTYEGVVKYDSPEMPVQSYSFKLGEEFDFVNLDRTKPKLTITMDGAKFVESYKLGEKEWKTVRTVDGNTMTATTTYGKTAVTQKLNKVA